jgi:uncharacterized membrane protein
VKLKTDKADFQFMPFFMYVVNKYDTMYCFMQTVITLLLFNDIIIATEMILVFGVAKIKAGDSVVNS